MNLFQFRFLILFWSFWKLREVCFDCNEIEEAWEVSWTHFNQTARRLHWREDIKENSVLTVEGKPHWGETQVVDMIGTENSEL